MLRRQDNRTVGVGQDIVLSVNGSQSTWHVVGIVREITAQPTAYVNYEYYSRQMGQQGLAQKAAVVTSGQNSGDIAPTLEQDLNASGMSVQSIVSQEELRNMVRTYLQVITSFLVIMSSLAIIVGCLGLVSTMNINIIERRREIGVMRAIGASNRAIYTMIAVESLVIGLLSWFLANLLAPPISILIGNIFGTIIFKSPLDISFSPIGVIAWLVLVIILAPLSSLLSARNALRMPVHEVLAYE
jgi:putative ABC transport system permease protein